MDRWLALPDTALQLAREARVRQLSREERAARQRHFGGECIKVKRFFQRTLGNIEGVDSRSKTSFMERATDWVDAEFAWLVASFDGNMDIGQWNVLWNRMTSISQEFHTIFDISEPPEDGKKTRMTLEEANIRVRRVLKESPSWDWTVRALVTKVRCSAGTISKCPAWQAYKERRDKLRREGTIETVSLTGELEAVLGTGEKDEVLNQLIAEQEQEDREDARQARLYVSHEKKRKRRES